LLSRTPALGLTAVGVYWILKATLSSGSNGSTKGVTTSVGPPISKLSAGDIYPVERLRCLWPLHRR